MRTSEASSLALTLTDSLEVIGNLAYLIRNNAPESPDMLHYLGLMDSEIARVFATVRIHLPDMSHPHDGPPPS
jgi:hypothetical protein